MPWDLLQEVLAEVFEDVLRRDFSLLNLAVEGGDAVDLILVRRGVDEALIDCRLDEGRLDLLTRRLRLANLEERNQLRVNLELVFVGHLWLLLHHRIHGRHDLSIGRRNLLLSLLELRLLLLMILRSLLLMLSILLMLLERLLLLLLSVLLLLLLLSRGLLLVLLLRLLTRRLLSILRLLELLRRLLMRLMLLLELLLGRLLLGLELVLNWLLLGNKTGATHLLVLRLLLLSELLLRLMRGRLLLELVLLGLLLVAILLHRLLLHLVGDRLELDGLIGHVRSSCGLCRASGPSSLLLRASSADTLIVFDAGEIYSVAVEKCGAPLTEISLADLHTRQDITASCHITHEHLGHLGCVASLSHHLSTQGLHLLLEGLKLVLCSSATSCMAKHVLQIDSDEWLLLRLASASQKST